MCDPILVALLKMRPHYSPSSSENATPSSGTSPSVATYKEVPPPGSSLASGVERVESGAVIERGGEKMEQKGARRECRPLCRTLLLSSILVLRWYSGAFQYDVIVQLRCFLSFNNFKLRITGAPNENIVQNHLNIALLNLFWYLNVRYGQIFIPQKFSICSDFLAESLVIREL